MDLPTWRAPPLRAVGAIGRRRVFFVLGCPAGAAQAQMLLDRHPDLRCRGQGRHSQARGPALDLALMHRRYPGAKFIHVIRDGRDAAASGWAHLQLLGRSEFGSFAEYAEHFAERHWVPSIECARQAAQSCPGQYLELRCEDLDADPPLHTARLLCFLGVDAGHDMVRGCLEGARFEGAAPHSGPCTVDRWRGLFDDEAAFGFDAAAGYLLRELGYPEPTRAMAGLSAP